MKKIALLCLLTGGMALTSFAGNGKSQLQKPVEKSKVEQFEVQNPPRLEISGCLVGTEIPLFGGVFKIKIRLGCVHQTIK